MMQYQAEISIFRSDLITNVGRYVSERSLSYWKDTLLGALPSDVIADRHFFIWDWRDWSVLFSKENVENLAVFPWKELQMCISAIGNKQLSVIIDSELEGTDYHGHFAAICDSLLELGISNDDILLWGNQYETGIPVKWSNCHGSWVIGHNLHSVEPQAAATHHFIMLARRPRPLRVMMSCELLRRNLDTYGYISCGSIDIPMDWDRLCPDPSLRDRFPLLIDGKQDEFMGTQYQVSDPKINAAAINIICETSQDKCFNDPSYELPFITEKTVKALVLNQIPLVVSVPGSVSLMRRYGIDMFDDLIDHGYDTEPDPRARIIMIANQLQILCQNADPNALRSHYWNRLEHNRSLAMSILNSHIPHKRQELLKWLQSSSRHTYA